MLPSALHATMAENSNPITAAPDSRSSSRRIMARTFRQRLYPVSLSAHVDSRPGSAARETLAARQLHESFTTVAQSAGRANPSGRKIAISWLESTARYLARRLPRASGTPGTRRPSGLALANRRRSAAEPQGHQRHVIGLTRGMAPDLRQDVISNCLYRLLGNGFEFTSEALDTKLSLIFVHRFGHAIRV